MYIKNKDQKKKKYYTAVEDATKKILYIGQNLLELSKVPV